MGLNTSAELRCPDPGVYPPAIKTPETKHNNVPPLTVSQGIFVTFYLISLQFSLNQFSFRMMRMPILEHSGFVSPQITNLLLYWRQALQKRLVEGLKGRKALQGLE